MAAGLGGYLKSSVRRPSESIDQIGFQTPLELGSQAKQRLEKLNNIPSRVSQKRVVREVEMAARVETGSELLKSMLDARKRQATAMRKGHEQLVAYRDHMHTEAQNVASADARFHESVMRHGLVMDTVKAEVNGLRAVLNGARTLVRED